MDTFSKKQRSDIMRAVKSKGNASTEIALIKLFKLYRLTGWRRNAKLLGNPDLYFPIKKIVVFADGCFWHGCRCKVLPASNEYYWNEKIKRNITRDKKITRELKRQGYIVFRIKECQIKKCFLPRGFLNRFTNT
jgi:DNA mismatch endonuclease (patch repair protein)